ncbi:hypothetical protein AMTR_s00122p00023550 [Amborella trichopoda]|uniref:Secreted protein n=1 Tax=Amborella trichopoda TaxID=13333 RepID=W1NPP6_AMBTC|nr:hypothetical protein AMTR_s00122p00023550 [Amborella trichopoda]
MAVGNARSMVLAATVMIQGAVFLTVRGSGPSFPAEHTTVIPRAMAWNAPMRTRLTSTRTLYTARRASGAPPRATPTASPRYVADATGEPTAVEAQCVPWPLMSRADTISVGSAVDTGSPSSASSPLTNQRAPMSLRLQFDELNCWPGWQIPFQRPGMGSHALVIEAL